MEYKFKWEEITTCKECPLLDAEQGYFCMLNEKAVVENHKKIIGMPDWCMLEVVPNKGE